MMRKLVILGGLACGLITVALWWSVFFHSYSEQETLLSTWSRTQLTLAKGAAGLAASRFAAQTPAGSRSLGGVAPEFANMLKQFQPAIISTAWVISNGKFIYSNQVDFSLPAEGQDVAQLFELQKEKGAANYSDFVQRVLNSSEGTGRFTWQVERGSELAAWASVEVNHEPWTLVLFTPESEILAESGLPENGQREMVGAGLLTVLLWGFFILAWRLPPRSGDLADNRITAPPAPVKQGRKYIDQARELRNEGQKLRSASTSGENFLAHLNHELWTPLNTITGLAYALQSQIYGPLNEKQVRSLETIRVTNQQLTGVVRNILDYSLIQAGNLRIEMKPVDADLLIDSSIAAQGQAAVDKQIQLEIKRDPAVKTILADEKRLGQVFESLLYNAIKFTPAGGKAGAQVEGDVENNQVKITIWDTGIGIGEVDIPMLFTPYVQLDAGLDRQQSGLGLGLSLAAKIVSFHGGSIGLESQPGGGTSFVITLPWHASSSKPGSAPDEPRGLLSTGLRHVKEPVRILLIDDDPNESQTLRRTFAEAGYEVRLVSRSEEAEREIFESAPALVLINLPLWGMDGLLTVRAIRAEPAMAKSVLIILAAVLVPGDRERFLQAGASIYMEKPLQPEQFATALNCLPETAALLME